MKYSSLLRCAVVAVLPAVLTGCLNLKPAPDLTRFYVLSSEPSLKPLTNAAWLSLRVCVASIETPAYLDTPRLVVRREGNQLLYAELDQWAEPLRDGLTRCLRDDLAALLGPGRVNPLSYRRPAGDCLEVQTAVSRFEATASGQAVLAVRWMIVQTKTGQVLHAQFSEFVQEVPNPTAAPEGAVRALSEDVARWSQQVAEALIAQGASDGKTAP